MAKKQTQQTYNDISKRQGQTASEFGDLTNYNQQQRAQTEGRQNESRASLGSAYGNLSSTPAQHVSTEGYTPIKEGYADIAGDGGYSGASRASLGENIAGLKELGRTGGIDSTSMNRFRGGGVYDEFASTGGLSGRDRSLMRAKAISPIGAMAQNTQDELNRRRNVQGGYGPGFDASSRALRRDTSRGISDASLNAELGIMDRVNAGRQWGAQGMSSSESSLQGLRTGNMLQGLNSAGNQEMAMNNSIVQNRLGGLGGMRGVQNDISGIEGQNINADTQREMAGIGGLQNLYSTDVNQFNNSRQAELSGMQGGTQADLGYFNPRTELATRPGMGGTIMNGIGAAAGMGSALISGMGNHQVGLGNTTRGLGGPSYDYGRRF